MLFRIINLRSHKNIVFIDSFDKSFNLVNLMIEREILLDRDLGVGDVIDVDVKDGFNKRGIPVKIVEQIHKILTHSKHLNYRTISDNIIVNYRRESLTRALNGSSNLKEWQLKCLLIREIENFLTSENYTKIYSSNSMDERGTSVVNPIKTISEYNGDRFLKITHELNLKKLCYLTLQPLYEIGYLARDVYDTKNGMHEYLSLELVSPVVNVANFEKYCDKISEIAINLANRIGVEYNKSFDNIKHIDVLSTFLKTTDFFNESMFVEYYKELLETNENCIFTNVPIDTPLAKKTEYGIPLETKWILNQDGIAHGYEDQSDVTIIKDCFEKQMKNLFNKGIVADYSKEFLEVMELAVVDTKSFSFGIDRFIQMFLNYEHSYKAYKILGV